MDGSQAIYVNRHLWHASWVWKSSIHLIWITSILLKLYRIHAVQHLMYRYEAVLTHKPLRARSAAVMFMEINGDNVPLLFEDGRWRRLTSLGSRFKGTTMAGVTVRRSIVCDWCWICHDWQNFYEWMKKIVRNKLFTPTILFFCSTFHFWWPKV